MRNFLAYFNLLNFLVMILVTLYISFNFRSQMNELIYGIYIYYIILGISGISISLWIIHDGKRLRKYALKLKKFENKILELEKKIKLIKNQK